MCKRTNGLSQGPQPSLGLSLSVLARHASVVRTAQGSRCNAASPLSCLNIKGRTGVEWILKLYGKLKWILKLTGRARLAARGR